MKKKEAFCASWIVPVDSPPMRQAALIVEQGRINAILPIHELNHYAKNLKIFNFPNGILLPAWVNAHSHLELSYLKNETIPHTDFLTWVKAQLAQRSQKETPQRIRQAALKQMHLMRRTGTALVGDITNGNLLTPLNHEPLERVIFYEILGFLPERASNIFEQAWERLQTENPQAILTAHALYSTSEELLQKIGAVSPRLSIHLAESQAEFDFFYRRSPEMIRFLKERQVWSDHWQSPQMTPVQYLNKLGLLKETTLVVHGVQVTNQDLLLLKESRAKVCLCLRSNDYLKVGQPPLEKYLENQIPLCLGTDSLASNTSLDLNDEIYYLWKRFNSVIEPVTLVKMATLNGARALGRDEEYGSLTVGKKAVFNVFEFDHPVPSEPERAVVSRKWRALQCF